MRRSIKSAVPVLLLAFAAPAHSGGLSIVEVQRDGVGGVDGLHGGSAVTVSPDGAHVYAAGRTDDAVAVFSRNAGTGALTFVEAQRQGVGGVDGIGLSTGVAVSPDGAHVYVTGEMQDSLAVFSRNAGTGALTFVEVEKDGIGGVDGLKAAAAVAVSPDGAHVYAVGQDDDAVAVFSRNAGTGALTFVEVEKNGIGGVDGMRRPGSLVVSPDGAHVYVASEGDDAVAVFSRNAGSGALTFVEFHQNNVAGVLGLQRPSAVTVSPDGATVYLAGQNDSAIVAFSRNAGTGALTFLEHVHNDGEVRGLQDASAVVVSPDGKYVYTTGSNNGAASVFRRDTASGTLLFLEVHFDGLLPDDGLQGASALAVSGDGADVYVTGREENALAVFKVDSCGNGSVGTDEECDDGGTLGGDGCSATCHLELCPPAPLGGCRQSESGRSTVKLTDRTVNRSDKLEFQFKHGQATAFAEFGDPITTTSYVLCVYDSSAAPQPLLDLAAPAGGVCVRVPCWRASNGRYRYGDKERSPDGLDTIDLREGNSDGDTKLKVRGKGSNLGMPPGLPLVAPLKLQLLNNQTGVCWDATFSNLVLGVSPSQTTVRGKND